MVAVEDGIPKLQLHHVPLLVILHEQRDFLLELRDLSLELLGNVLELADLELKRACLALAIPNHVFDDVRGNHLDRRSRGRRNGHGSELS